jgi:signal transduction histidine kinase
MARKIVPNVTRRTSEANTPHLPWTFPASSTARVAYRSHSGNRLVTVGHAALLRTEQEPAGACARGSSGGPALRPMPPMAPVLYAGPVTSTDEIRQAANHRLRVWLGSRLDVVVTLSLGVVQILGTFGAARGQPEHEPLDALAIILLAAGPVALLARHRFPVSVYFFVLAATMAYSLIGYPRGPIFLSLLIAFFTVVITGHRLAAILGLVAGYFGFLWLPFLLDLEPAPTLAASLGLAAWLLVILSAAEFVRVRRERALESARIHEEEARRRASEERLRIARELHDALGHHISLINVQAGVALHVNEQLPKQARSALDTIRQASKEALTELRSVLDILREGGEQAPRSPTPSLARLDNLVSRAAAAGLTVRTETVGEVRPLPFGVDVAAFRIVQEALTNVARHAGPATATVQITYGLRDVTVQVDDDGRASAQPAKPGSGKGIVGMRERVAALSGELEAGPRPGGGFRVRAWLPLDGAG